jgi:hypothetical protein
VRNDASPDARGQRVVVVALGVLDVAELELMSVDPVEPEAVAGAPIDVPLPVAEPLAVASVLGVAGAVGAGATAVDELDDVSVLLVTGGVVVVVVEVSVLRSPQAASDRAAIRARMAQRAMEVLCISHSLRFVDANRGIREDSAKRCLRAILPMLRLRRVGPHCRRL